MEVTVLEATNTPLKPVLAVRAESVFRQAKLEVNQPFIIPHPGSTSCTVEVSVFQQLATQNLPDDEKPEALCSIPVRRHDGTASEVSLRVTRGGGAVPTKASSQDDIGATRTYLEHHQLQSRIQSLIQDVLREQPANPYKYMMESLKSSRSAAEKEEEPKVPAAAAPPAAPAPEAASAPEEPLVPRPPAGPKPDGSKAPAGRVFRKAGSTDAVGSANQQSGGAKGEEAINIARATIGLLLRAAPCKDVAEESLRHCAQQSVARSLSRSIVTKCVQQEIVQANTLGVRRSSMKESRRCSRSKASTYTESQVKTMTSMLTCYMAYQGAAERMRNDSAMSKNLEMLPVPLVALTAQSESWGSWLSRGM
eukprot:TRINITY_DN2232_c0_g2_i1.p1 TRINITY_DN2232_c0_g2~~TRINITY_DN2232_c0_g2_i1.p1  ORF type:complete len:365 (-),score=94.75 TRINITY_DN2232_c0_g2_i1:196-1290(-)